MRRWKDSGYSFFLFFNDPLTTERELGERRIAYSKVGAFPKCISASKIVILSFLTAVILQLELSLRIELLTQIQADLCAFYCKTCLLIFRALSDPVRESASARCSSYKGELISPQQLSNIQEFGAGGPGLCSMIDVGLRFEKEPLWDLTRLVLTPNLAPIIRGLFVINWARRSLAGSRIRPQGTGERFHAIDLDRHYPLLARKATTAISASSNRAVSLVCLLFHLSCPFPLFSLSFSFLAASAFALWSIDCCGLCGLKFVIRLQRRQ